MPLIQLRRLSKPSAVPSVIYAFPQEVKDHPKPNRTTTSTTTLIITITTAEVLEGVVIMAVEEATDMGDKIKAVSAEESRSETLGCPLQISISQAPMRSLTRLLWDLDQGLLLPTGRVVLPSPREAEMSRIAILHRPERTGRAKRRKCNSLGKEDLGKLRIVLLLIIRRYHSSTRFRLDRTLLLLVMQVQEGEVDEEVEEGGIGGKKRGRGMSPRLVSLVGSV